MTTLRPDQITYAARCWSREQDTMQIALKLGVPESVIYNALADHILPRAKAYRAAQKRWAA